MAYRDKSYTEKYKDPRWQKKRLTVLERDEFVCQSCFDAESTLHVHHRFYIKGRDPWDYDDSVLVTLCEPCHEKETLGRKKADEQLVKAFRLHFLNAQISEMAEALSATHLPHVPEIVSPALVMMFDEYPVFNSVVTEHIDRCMAARLSQSADG